MHLNNYGLILSLVPRLSFSFWLAGEESLAPTVCACLKITVYFVYAYNTSLIPLSPVPNNRQRSVTVAIVRVY